MKKLLVVLLAGLMAVGMAAGPVAADDTYSPAFYGQVVSDVRPTEDPNFVEQSLEEFMDENPGYTGYPDYGRYNPEMMADSETWYEWSQVGNYWYLYRCYYSGAGAIQRTLVVNEWYQDPETGIWYFLKGGTGQMATGWCQVGNYWYYFNAGGAMQTDWYEVSNVWYYLCIGSLADAEGVPEGAALKGERFLPSSVGSTTRTQSYYFDYNCGMVEWEFPLPEGVDAESYDPYYYTEYYVNSRFAEWRDLDEDGINDNCHNGLDLRARTAIPITSVSDGTVLYASFMRGGGETVVIKTSTRVPSSSNVNNYLNVRFLHMTKGSIRVTPGLNITSGYHLGDTGNSGEVDFHFHMDVNAHGIIDKAVSGNNPSTMGQNPAAFFPDIAPDEWVYKNPHGWAYCGYSE